MQKTSKRCLIKCIVSKCKLKVNETCWIYLWLTPVSWVEWSRRKVGPKTSSDWQPFLSNDNNKDEYFRFLPEEADKKFYHFSEIIFVYDNLVANKTDK